MGKLHKFDARVLAIEDLTPSVKHFKLSIPSNFTFTSGQFITIRFSDENGKTLKRSYSIASSPKYREHIEMVVKYVENGPGSKYLWSLSEGDTIQCHGPLGAFVVKNLSNPMVFISTGTGIGPFRSMLYDLVEQKCEKDLMLLAGYRYENGELYGHEFEKLSMHPNVTYHCVISRPEPNFKGKIGRVQQLVEGYVKDTHADFYLCGLDKMIQDVKSLLISKGVKEEQIHTEKYD